MVGGKDHTTHHLVYAGLSDKQAWYIFVLISLLSAFFCVVLVYLANMGIIIPILFFILFFLAVFFFLYRITLKYKAPKQ